MPSERRSKVVLGAIDTEPAINAAATRASVQIANARSLFEQARLTSETAKPILYYYASVSFLEFITSCLVSATLPGRGSHGLFVDAPDENVTFDRDWPGKCKIGAGENGDFPFFVDALAAAGWPSLFSTFRLYRPTTADPWESISNPQPLLMEACSLSVLCNFDLERYYSYFPKVKDWVNGCYESNLLIQMTEFLLDYVIVYAASCIARYSVPAWRGIIAAEKSDIFNDIRRAYVTLSERLPYSFAQERPFSDSFETVIV